MRADDKASGEQVFDMTAVVGETICIDVDEDEVQFCKWDGREIRVERGMAIDLTDATVEGIRRLSPRPGFQLRYRIAEGAAGHDEVARRVEEVARKAGAGAIRRLPVDIRAEPGLTAARHAADRHRLGEIVCLELRRGSFLCANVDVRGRVSAHERGKWSDANAICAAVSRARHDAVSLVCYGSAASEASAIEIAKQAGFGRILIPDYAASLAVMGMLIVDLVFELRAGAPTAATDLRGLREGSARLMDEAARQVTLEGYDIDDTICERLVELADRSRVPLEGITVPPVDVRALHLRVTIQTPKVSPPPSPEEDRLITIQD